MYKLINKPAIRGCGQSMKHLEETKKLLDYIHENPEVTQRELMEKLNISLGKVNFLIKALAREGTIKLKRFHNSRSKIGYLYLITPKGLKQKAVLTKNFLKIKLNEYDRLIKDIESLKQQANDFEF
jgi:EPS-associated MarR family transcriptional regulator